MVLHDPKADRIKPVIGRLASQIVTLERAIKDILARKVDIEKRLHKHEEVIGEIEGDSKELVRDLSEASAAVGKADKFSASSRQVIASTSKASLELLGKERQLAMTRAKIEELQRVEHREVEEVEQLKKEVAQETKRKESDNRGAEEGRRAAEREKTTLRNKRAKLDSDKRRSEAKLFSERAAEKREQARLHAIEEELTRAHTELERLHKERSKYERELEDIENTPTTKQSKGAHLGDQSQKKI